MQAIDCTFTGRLADDPVSKEASNGSPKVLLTLIVSTRANRTRWYKVIAYDLLAIRAAESLHKNDQVTVRCDDVDTWGRIDNRPRDEDDDGPRVMTWAFFTAYDIALSVAKDSAVSGRAARAQAAADDTADESADEPVDAAQEANLSVIAGVTADSAV